MESIRNPSGQTNCDSICQRARALAIKSVLMIKRLCGLLATMLATLAPANAADAQHAPTLAWHFTGIEALAKSNPEAILNEISASRPAFFLAIQVP